MQQDEFRIEAFSQSPDVPARPERALGKVNGEEYPLEMEHQLEAN